MAKLFEEYQLGPLKLNNRIVIAPMCQYSANEGEATDWHLMHLSNMAFSGAGLLIIEASAVEAEGRISPHDLGIWSDATESALKRVLTSIQQYSSMPIGIQLAHAGRKASTQVPWKGGKQVNENEGGWQTVAPSAIAYSEDDKTPTALDKAGLQRIVDGFVKAAIRAHRIGISLIEIHAAHGYLLHQFLSPLSNQRTDEYGGCLDNRMRFPLAVFEAVRNAVPDTMAVGIRISGTDWVDGGWNLEESIQFGHAVKKLGCDFIHVSSGGLSPKQKIPVGPDYQVPLAEKMREQTNLPTIAVGLITEAEQAEAIIANQQADMVALARGMLYDPRWPWHAAAKLGAQVTAPNQYLRCQPHGLKDLFVQE
ncbi:MAG: NADH:flavin oxidoreductase/NADH oxidase [Methylophilus sp.]|jgi:2,4-dienoyl-CoA reductase-like NADH-dependent reductase (Old Yellow Enzyme family)